MPLLRCLLPWVLLVVACGQRADPGYEPRVRRPTWPAGKGPRVLFDEGHHNAHGFSNRYGPFASLLSADGYRIEPLKDALSSEKHRFGMNLPGIDNQQFVLNVLHWLSGLLPASASSDERE